jgi:succinyl-CoA synthetase beta subunit
MQAAIKIGKPVIVKAQVLVGGRGKAGGIKSASTADEVYDIAKELLGTTIKGCQVQSVLVDTSEKPRKELYLGFTIDRAKKRVVLLASSQGGINIEEVAKSSATKIFREEIDPFLGLHPYQAREAAEAIGLSGRTAADFAIISQKIFQIFELIEADLVESNPLAIRDDGSLVALDARISIDDNALYRSSFSKRAQENLTPLEIEARAEGLAFVQLDGNIGIIANGAGLVMITLDAVAHFGGRPANFLDMVVGTSAERFYIAIMLCLKQKDLKALFINIFGGFTKCDDVANGLVRALHESQSKIPVVVRMVGRNEEEGRKILAKNQIVFLESLEQGAELVVKSARI